MKGWGLPEEMSLAVSHGSAAISVFSKMQVLSSPTEHAAEGTVDIRDIFNAPDRSIAEMSLKIFIKKHAKSAPRLSS